MKKKINFSFLILFSLLLLNSFAYQEPAIQAKMPETLEEAGKIAERAFFSLPEILKKTGQDFLSTWKNIWRKIENLYQKYLGSKVKVLWKKIINFFTQEIKKRKEIIEEEIPKEKEEIKRNIPQRKKSLW